MTKFDYMFYQLARVLPGIQQNLRWKMQLLLGIVR